MDTTYFGRNFGVMVFRSQPIHRNIFWRYLPYETIHAYQEGVEYLQSLGWNISGIVCDGRRGIFNAFGSIPVQMCQYHQMAIITRYITRNPLLEAGKDLYQIIRKLAKAHESDFVYYLNEWYDNWADFLMEKSVHPETGKWHYTH